jgi:ABC-2 type transport system ATP-binding protein/lipopolysaccharide transport system ATP-binding protein
MPEPLVSLSDVSLCYRLAKQRIPSLKEYAIHFVKGALTYEKLWALTDVSRDIARGETVGIVGRNGAGKSTLLKVISRILKPTRGTLEVRGRVAPILELGAGFDYELTGRENVFLNGLLLGHSRREIVAAFDSIVAFSELGDFIDSPIRNYSSGMQARLGFSVATAWRPDLLILDEVLAVGDVAFRKKCANRIAELHRDGSTVLVVAHSREPIVELCSRCLLLRGGRLEMDGPPGAVFDAYEAAIPAPAPVAG